MKRTRDWRLAQKERIQNKNLRRLMRQGYFDKEEADSIHEDNEYLNRRFGNKTAFLTHEDSKAIPEGFVYSYSTRHTRHSQLAKLISRLRGDEKGFKRVWYKNKRSLRGKRARLTKQEIIAQGFENEQIKDILPIRYKGYKRGGWENMRYSNIYLLKQKQFIRKCDDCGWAWRNDSWGKFCAICGKLSNKEVFTKESIYEYNYILYTGVRYNRHNSIIGYAKNKDIHPKEYIVKRRFESYKIEVHSAEYSPKVYWLFSLLPKEGKVGKFEVVCSGRNIHVYTKHVPLYNNAVENEDGIKQVIVYSEDEERAKDLAIHYFGYKWWENI